jgi:hypothetical protein
MKSRVKKTLFQAKALEAQKVAERKNVVSDALVRAGC